MKVLFFTLGVIILDQITKLLVKGISIGGFKIEGMPYGSSKQVLGDFIKLTFIENPGMAFGIDIGPKMFLTIFTIVASLVILYYIYKHRRDTFVLRLALAFILAGAAGNLIDRTFYGLIYDYAPLFHGRVVDFLQVDTWDFTIFGRTYTTWPIFNVADISVTAGFLIILFFHNTIFKHEDEGQILNDADGSPINERDMITHNELDTTSAEVTNEKDMTEEKTLRPAEHTEDRSFTGSGKSDSKDMDGASIIDGTMQPPIDEDELNRIDSTIENKQKNNDTDPAGTEETKNR